MNPMLEWSRWRVRVSVFVRVELRGEAVTQINHGGGKAVDPSGNYTIVGDPRFTLSSRSVRHQNGQMRKTPADQAYPWTHGY